MNIKYITIKIMLLSDEKVIRCKHLRRSLQNLCEICRLFLPYGLDIMPVIYMPKVDFISGPGSSVGIATGYVLDGPGIEFQWG
jgi:hypothetical protein